MDKLLPAQSLLKVLRDNFSLPLLIDILNGCITYIILFGMSLPLFIYLAKVSIARGFRSWSNRITSLAALTGLLLFCLLVASGIVVTFFDATPPLLLSENRMNSEMAITMVKRRSYIANLPRTFAVYLLLYLSDSMVIWRASFVLYNRLYMTRLLWLFWALGLVSILAYQLQAVIQGVYNSGTYSTNLRRTGQYISVAINLLTTGLIYYELWNHRNLARPIHGVTESQRVLLLLVETGAVFCILQVLYCVMQELSYRGTVPNTFTSLMIQEVLLAIRSAFSAIYPSLVVILVEAGKAVTESYDFDTLVHDPVSIPEPTEE